MLVPEAAPALGDCALVAGAHAADLVVHEYQLAADVPEVSLLPLHVDDEGDRVGVKVAKTLGGGGHVGGGQVVVVVGGGSHLDSSGGCLGLGELTQEIELDVRWLAG